MKVKDLETQYLERECKDKILFRLKGDKKNSWRVLKASCGWCQKARDHLKSKFGKKLARIANQEIDPL